MEHPLEKSGLILRVDYDKTFVPARDIETINLSEISSRVRDEFQDTYSALNDFISIPRIENILSEVQNAIDNILSKETLKDLVTSRTRENKKTI